MKFADMLQQKISPRTAHRTHNTILANEARLRQGRATYLPAMAGKGWMTTAEVEQAVGNRPRTAWAWLVRAHAHGRVEKRPVGGEFIQARGWEWRWK